MQLENLEEHQKIRLEIENKNKIGCKTYKDKRSTIYTDTQHLK